MNRMRMTLMALALALVAFGAPAAGSAFAARHVVVHPAQAAAPSGKVGGLIAFVASVVGVTPAVLQQDLAAGQTLLQIAGSKYPSADALATALLAPVKTALDGAASSNRLAPTQASTLYSQLHARVVTLVTTPHPALGALTAIKGSGKAAGGKANGKGNGKTGVGVAGIRSGFLQSFVTTCKTTPAAFTAAVHTGGKTLLAICQATNASVTQASLVGALTAAAKTKLDAAVAAKTLSPTQESTALANLQSYLNTLVTTPIPAGGPGKH